MRDKPVSVQADQYQRHRRQDILDIRLRSAQLIRGNNVLRDFLLEKLIALEQQLVGFIQRRSALLHADLECVSNRGQLPVCAISAAACNKQVDCHDQQQCQQYAADGICEMLPVSYTVFILEEIVLECVSQNRRGLQGDDSQPKKSFHKNVTLRDLKDQTERGNACASVI